MRLHKLSLIVMAAVLSAPAFADTACKAIHGKLSELVVAPFASPNDPLGRNLVTALGTLNAIGTSIFTTVGPGPIPGTLGATTKHLFLVSEEDQLTALGVAVFTPIAGTPNVGETLTLTITGGTGKFATATGTITATGTGFNFFPLPPGPSSANKSFFEFDLSGEICGVN